MTLWAILVIILSITATLADDKPYEDEISKSTVIGETETVPVAVAVDEIGEKDVPIWDPNGYIIFCLCMGRIGNKMDHFLGGLHFAKAINRTLILGPIVTDRNIPFDEWYQVAPLQSYHRVILADDFMQRFASEHWPPGKRTGFCWMPKKTDKCVMNVGHPFATFWNGLGIDFDDSIVYQITYSNSDVPKWKQMFPSEKYPVIALRGAPAQYPVQPEHRYLQKFIHFSDHIEYDAQNYIDANFPNKTFIGIHLRNGNDWVKACENVDGKPNYMSSTQCSHLYETISREICLPSEDVILRQLANSVERIGAAVVFVATDRYSMMIQIENAIPQVKVYHLDPHLPMIDQAILIKASHFIGNCVSSFTAYVKRSRDVLEVSSEFWGL